MLELQLDLLEKDEKKLLMLEVSILKEQLGKFRRGIFSRLENMNKEMSSLKERLYLAEKKAGVLEEETIIDFDLFETEQNLF